jgi:hypothetical protein
MVWRALATADVEATWMHQRPGATASQDIQLAAGGERHFPPGGYAPGVLADFRLGEREWALLRDVDVIAIPVFRQLMPLVEPIIVARDLSAMRVADLLDGADPGRRAAGARCAPRYVRTPLHQRRRGDGRATLAPVARDS